MPELVDAAAGHHLHRALHGRGPLRGHHDREVPAALVAAPDQPADLLDVEGTLGDEDHIGAACQPGVERDPAGVAAHHLDHEVAVVALRGGVEAVDGVGRDLEGGVEAERHVRPAEVVVDRLRHADDRQPIRAQARRRAERVLSADDDQPVQLQVGQRRADPLGAVIPAQWVRPRRPEDGPPARQDPPDRLDRKLLPAVLDRAPPAVAEP